MFVLAFSMGHADGEFSESELKDLCNNNPVYTEYAQQITLNTKRFFQLND